MDHLEQLAVTFEGSISRQKVQDGVAIKYFRNSFVVDGKSKTVSSNDDLQGLSGVVQFVKKGEATPTGGTVAQDAFSLVSVTSIAGLRNKRDSIKLSREIADLG